MNIILKKKINLIIILIFIFSGCNKKDITKLKKPEPIPRLEVLYKQAFTSYEEGDWINSIKLFQKVETRYSFTEWAPKATLMIIFIYYETGDYYNTLEYVKKFKSLYPKNKNTDYVDFIRSMTFYEQINVVSRDQTYTKVALNEFKNLIKKYPNSIYAEEARLKIDLINEQIAGKHMYIARYYMKKSKWIPAIKRLKLIFNNFQTTIYIDEALHRLVEIYYRLGNEHEAKKYAAYLGYNFNESDWYKKSYEVIVNKSYYNKDEKNTKKLKDRVIKLFKFSK